MINLNKDAGLPVLLNDDAEKMQLEFGEQVTVESVKNREIAEMMEVLAQKPHVAGGMVIYRMYDGVYLQKDLDLLSRKKLRYDLTLMYPGKLGREYIKTAGHYHSISDDHSFSYPELYEVLYGEVHFILQKRGGSEDEIEDIVVVQANRGQRIVIPPNYGHVAVNPGHEPLVLANWIATECKPDYKHISQYGGAAVFEIEESGNPRFIVNKKYRFAPEVRIIKVDQHLTSILDLGKEIPLYYLLVESPNSLDWLRYPSREIEKFEEYIGKKID